MFMILFVLLYLSQLFLISPGSDIVGIRAPVYVITTIGGLTYSSVMSLLISVYILFNVIFHRKRDFSKDNLIVLWAILAFLSIGLTSSLEIGIWYGAQIAMKMLLPFLFYFFIRYSFEYKKLDNIYNGIVFINFILIGQVLVCKLITGRFSASVYYYLLKEEYFGYYNSPHPFAALIGLLSIWNLKCVNDGNNKNGLSISLA